MIAPYCSKSARDPGRGKLTLSLKAGARWDTEPPFAVVTAATWRLGNDNVFGASDAYRFLLFVKLRRRASRCLLKSRPSRSEGYGCDSPLSPFQSTMLKLSESSLSSAVKSKSLVLSAQ